MEFYQQAARVRKFALFADLQRARVMIGIMADLLSSFTFVVESVTVGI